MSAPSGREGSVAGRSPVDRTTFRGLPPTVRDAKGRVRHPALTDELTGLPNRLYFDVVYRILWEAGGRGIPVTLVLFDLPGLGEATPEQQLEVGEVVGQVSRQMDMVARLGPDRMGALLMECNAFGALIAAERFQAELTHVLSRLGFAFSAGIAAWKDWMREPEDLMGAAEKAVSAADPGGKNPIEIHNA